MEFPPLLGHESHGGLWGLLANYPVLHSRLRHRATSPASPFRSGPGQLQNRLGRIYSRQQRTGWGADDSRLHLQGPQAGLSLVVTGHTHLAQYDDLNLDGCARAGMRQRGLGPRPPGYMHSSRKLHADARRSARGWTGVLLPPSGRRRRGRYCSGLRLKMQSLPCHAVSLSSRTATKNRFPTWGHQPCKSKFLNADRKVPPLSKWEFRASDYGWCIKSNFPRFPIDCQDFICIRQPSG